MIVLLLALSSACDPATPAPAASLELTASDQEEILALPAAYAERALAGDLVSWSEVFHVDALRMNAGMPPLEGRQAILDWIMGSGLVVHHLDITIHEMEGNRQLAWLRGAFRMEGGLISDDQVALEDEGKFLMIVQPDDEGRWLVYRHIAHSDL